MTKYSEQDRVYHRELIWKNAFDLFENRKYLTPRVILRHQRKFINDLGLEGKNRYKTVYLLNTYFQSRNKLLAEQIFYSTFLNKIK